jgi:hypothetical protein
MTFDLSTLNYVDIHKKLYDKFGNKTISHSDIHCFLLIYFYPDNILPFPAAPPKLLDDLGPVLEDLGIIYKVSTTVNKFKGYRTKKYD